MEPRFLAPDELEYEFTLRGLDPHGPQSIDRLKQALRREADGAVPPPTDDEGERVTRNAVTNELQMCERKLNEIQHSIDVAEQRADDPLADRGQSRIMHLAGRVSRLQQRAPTHSAEVRLLNRVVELEQRADAVRDSLGAGQMAIGGGEDEASNLPALDAPPPNEHLHGARPRTSARAQQPGAAPAPALPGNAPPSGYSSTPPPRVSTPARFNQQSQVQTEAWGAMFQEHSTVAATV